MEFLNVLSKGLVLGSCDGQQTIAQAKDVFTYRDADFENWGTDEPSEPTRETKVNVYELRKGATLNQMFNDISLDLDKLCLSQGQIIGFVQKYRKRLRDGYATFFLFRSGGKIFVAGVYVSSGGEGVGVGRLGGVYVWDACYHLRLVAPQLP